MIDIFGAVTGALSGVADGSISIGSAINPATKTAAVRGHRRPGCHRQPANPVRDGSANVCERRRPYRPEAIHFDAAHPGAGGYRSGGLPNDISFPLQRAEFHLVDLHAIEGKASISRQRWGPSIRSKSIPRPRLGRSGTRSHQTIDDRWPGCFRSLAFPHFSAGTSARPSILEECGKSE